jgi:hypothetical protein
MRSQEEGARIDEERAMAKMEDVWDGIVYRLAKEEGRLGLDGDGGGGGDVEERDGFEEPPYMYQASFTYWLQRSRSIAWEAFERRKWDFGVRGWQMWQKVKRERWLSERETIPSRLAAVVKASQRLQDEVQLKVGAAGWGRGEMAVEAKGWRSTEEYDELMAELKAMGPLHVPVEWSEKIVDKQWPKYLQEVARERERGIDISQQKRDLVMRYEAEQVMARD